MTINQNQMEPKFIVLEGLDGVGKSTQAELIQEELAKLGIKSVITTEPTDKSKNILKQGSNVVGKLIREILDSHNVLDLFSLQLLFCADRGYHQAEFKEIKKSGVWIICDRYKFSTLAYMLSKDEGRKYFGILKEINDQFMTPDITILIDHPAEKCIKQLDESRDHRDFFEQAEKLEKIRVAYLDLTKIYDIEVIERLEKTPEEICQEAMVKIKRKFGI